MSIMKRFSIYVWTIILIVVEQLTKIAVLTNIKSQSITIIRGILKFSYCENRGVAFSLGSGHILLFIILNVIMLCGLVFFYEKNRDNIVGMQKVFYTMVLAGGSSNLIDRITKGYVIDFIDINEVFSFAIFNVADILLVIGICGFCIMMILKGMKK